MIYAKIFIALYLVAGLAVGLGFLYKKWNDAEDITLGDLFVAITWGSLFGVPMGVRFAIEYFIENIGNIFETAKDLRIIKGRRRNYAGKFLISRESGFYCLIMAMDDHPDYCIILYREGHCRRQYLGKKPNDVSDTIPEGYKLV